MSCLQEREIDDLVFDRLSADAEKRCLSHLLWCGECQERVEEERAFARATRSALLLLESQKLAARGALEPAAGWGQRLTEWIGLSARGRWRVVTAAVCLAAATAIYVPLHRGADGGAEVMLRSERGMATPARVELAAGAQLRLKIDVTDVGPQASYNVSLVDAVGRTMESRQVTASGGSASFAPERRLVAGRYWVRLSTPDGQLLREYALQVR